MARRKRKKKEKSIVNKIFMGITVLISVLLIIMITVLNILPFNYLCIIYVGVLIFDIVIFLLLRKKKKKLGYFIASLFIIIGSIGIYYLGVTNNFLSYFNKDNYKLEKYLVLVLKDSDYQKLKDLENEDIGYVKNDITSINKAIDKINKKIKIENREYDNYDLVFKDALSYKLESILIEESSYNMIIEENGNYKDLFRIIDTIKILTKVNNRKSNVDVTKDAFSIFISGIDTYGEISSVGRSDVNMIITVNPKTKQILLTSIPRDYYVQLHGTTGYKDKLTHAGIYGTDMSIDTIEDLLGIDINYYFRVNFSTLEKIVDSLGGVDVYSKYSFVSFIGNYKFYTGYNHMNGAQALGFARERKTLPSGDINRAENQQAVIDGIIRKMTSFSSITRYTNLINSLGNSFQTNLKDTDITNLIKMQLKDKKSWNITSNVLIGEGASEYTYSYKGQKLYVMMPDSDSISKAKSMINEVIDGKVLESSYDKSASDVKSPTQVSGSSSSKKVEEKKEEVKKEEIKKEENKNKTPIDDNVVDENTNQDDNQNNSNNSNDNSDDNEITNNDNNDTMENDVGDNSNDNTKTDGEKTEDSNN